MLRVATRVAGLDAARAELRRVDRGEQLSLTGVRRAGDEPTEHLARIVSMFAILLRDNAVSFAWYSSTFQRSERSFARDLRQLRTIGKDIGVVVSQQHDGRATLVSTKGKNRLRDGEPDRQAMLRTIARAVGVPVAHELGLADGLAPGVASDGGTSGGDDFVVFAVPALLDGSAAAQTFAALRAAHEARARVRFAYRTGAAKTLRVVEPYRVIVRSGRYYLIGFDTAPRKGWRYFALDQIAGPVTRAGTFKPRAIPAAYHDCDAIGMMQGGPSVEVTIRLSPAVAASAASRRWQAAQRVIALPGGSADFTFTVNDVMEAVRWALGFGAEAQVIAPDAAVEAARATIGALDSVYAIAPRRARVG